MKSNTHNSFTRFQDRLVKLLGNSVDGRTLLVAAMLKRDASEATSYWLQLVVSVGIATLGLVVGSAAVVIGAMLVAPLMGPIVGLAMGLASGSPFLVLRSAGRIALSMIIAVGGSALITLMLPFHELNAEIVARASPTVLDLITAGFCALAGVYAALRPGSDTATTAAGTSISISLVPPLCASGYGLGTAARSIAGGASLLFLTNLVAIVVVGTMAFVAAGMNQVDVVALERDELTAGGSDAPIARNLSRRLSKLFASGWGPALRFLMPFLLLAAVYVPLRRALDEVAWQVRVRAAVRASLANSATRVVQSRTRVERHEVEVVLVLLGSNTDAEHTRSRLDRELRQASGVVPRIEVIAVPDATAFAGLESTLLTPHHVEAPVVSQEIPTPEAQLESSRALVRQAVERLWPSVSVGRALMIDIGATDAARLRLRVVHLGIPLAQDTIEMLQLSIKNQVHREIQLIDVAVSPSVMTAQNGPLMFVSTLASAVRATASIASVQLCLTRPQPVASRRPTADEQQLELAIRSTVESFARRHEVEGAEWTARFVDGPCEIPADGDDGGSSVDGQAVR